MVFKCIILLILKKYSSRWEMWTLRVCTYAHIHLPGIWMSRDHTWRSAHCTGTEHSCPCQQRWALGPLEKPRPTQRCGDGRTLRRIPGKHRSRNETWSMCWPQTILHAEISLSCSHMIIPAGHFGGASVSASHVYTQLRVIPLSKFWAHIPLHPSDPHRLSCSLLFSNN